MSDELYSEEVTYFLKSPADSALEEKIKQDFQGFPGVENIVFENDRITVVYYPQAVSSASIEEEMESLHVNISPQPGGSGSSFLDKLILSNEKTFGHAPLECCSLNNKKKH